MRRLLAARIIVLLMATAPACALLLGDPLERGATSSNADGGPDANAGDQTSSTLDGSLLDGQRPNYVQKLAVGNTTGCVIRDDIVYCWGTQPYEQLNRPDLAGGPSDIPIPILGPEDGGLDGGVFRATSVSSKMQHICAVHAGAVYCWGYTDNQLLGDGTGPTGKPVTIAGTVVEVSAGDRFTCARTLTDVYCWGDHDPYEMLTSEFSATIVDGGCPDDSRQAFRIGSLTNARLIALGWHHACAVVSNQTRCWGRNDFEQAGRDASGGCRHCSVSVLYPCLGVPLEVGGLGDVQAIAPGDRHTCALLVNGDVRCWGANEWTQLGDPAVGETVCTLDSDASSDPLRCTAVPTLVLQGVSQVATGADATCALKNGEVWCWGLNFQGKIGRGDMDYKGMVPGRVETAPGVPLNDVREISVGYRTVCAIKNDGSLWCWGEELGKPAETISYRAKKLW